MLAGTALLCGYMVGPNYRRPPALPERAVKLREVGHAIATADALVAAVR